MKDVKTKNIIMLTIAGLINAFGITVFLAPVKLYDSSAYITITEVADVFKDNI